MPAFAFATVTSTSPLRLTMDGDTSGVTVPAKNYSALTLTVGTRVRIELRAPLPPLVVGTAS